MKNKLTCYLSHHIRGPEGDHATEETRMHNKQVAQMVGMELRRQFPNLTVYVPGDADEWAEVAYVDGLLSVDTILDIDCAIIDRKDCMIMYHQYDKMGGGMVREMNHCEHTDKPFIVIKDMSEESLMKLEDFLNGVATDGKTSKEASVGH